MPTESKHTPEPWYIAESTANSNNSVLAKAAGRTLLVAYDLNDAPDLARAVACVNACEGMTDPAADIAALRAPRGPVFLAVYIGTTNDTNGNPRRGWYVSRLDGAPLIAAAPTGRNSGKDAAYTCWVEEGYSGNNALYGAVSRVSGIHTGSSVGRDRDAARALVHQTGRINVTPGEYRDARKLPRFGGGS